MSAYRPKRARRDTFDNHYPPNETPETIARWEAATKPEGGRIPAGTLYIEKWSNGHYTGPQFWDRETLDHDNAGQPLRTCERRIYTPKETP